MIGIKDGVTVDDPHIDLSAFSASDGNCVATSAHQDLDALDFFAYETYGTGSSTEPATAQTVKTSRDSGPRGTGATGGDEPQPGRSRSSWTPPPPRCWPSAA